MSSHFIPSHGGQLQELATQFQIPEESLLDFSASINPQPPSDTLIETLCESLRSRKIITNYPDIEYRELRKSIAQYAGINAESIVIGNGVMPLLAAAIRALRIRRCLVVVPAFSEYRRTMVACDTDCHAFVLSDVDGFRLDRNRVLARLKSTDSQALLLANPHSPSGALTSLQELRQIQEAAAALGVITIVDEAFIDYCPEESLTSSAAESKNLVVLRSLTKFFSMAGLRVAYGIVHPDTRLAMKASIPLWPVDSIATEAARLAVKDQEWAADARRSNARERDCLANRLRALRLAVFPSTANHLLLKIHESRDGLEFWRRLVVDHGIVVRSCANFEGLNQQYLRVGIRTCSENRRLLHSLARLLSP